MSNQMPQSSQRNSQIPLLNNPRDEFGRPGSVGNISIHNAGEMERIRQEHLARINSIQDRRSYPRPDYLAIKQVRQSTSHSTIPLAFTSIHPDDLPAGQPGGRSSHNAAELEAQRNKKTQQEQERMRKQQEEQLPIHGSGLREGFEYIGETALTETEASRVFLFRPLEGDVESRDALALQTRLSTEYGVSPAVIREIWKTKMVPGTNRRIVLNSWQTDAMPPILDHPDVNKPRNILFQTTLDEDIVGIPIRADVKGLPAHKLIQREEGSAGASFAILCNRPEEPPFGCIDVSIIEAVNLPVPHHFQDFFNPRTISSYAQVELRAPDDGGMVIKQFLKTSVMGKDKCDIYRRSTIDPVFNQTLRFSEIVDNETFGELNISFFDSHGVGSGFLGQRSIPLSKVLRKGALLEGWYELMDEDNLFQMKGQSVSKKCCVLLRVSANPIPEAVLIAKREAALRESQIKAQALMKTERDRVDRLEALQRRRTEDAMEEQRREESEKQRLAEEGSRLERIEEERKKMLLQEQERIELETRTSVLELQRKQLEEKERLAQEEQRLMEEEEKMMHDARQRRMEQEERLYYERIKTEQEDLRRTEMQGQIEDLRKKRDELLSLQRFNEELEDSIRFQQERLQAVQSQPKLQEESVGFEPLTADPDTGEARVPLPKEEPAPVPTHHEEPQDSGKSQKQESGMEELASSGALDWISIEDTAHLEGKWLEEVVDTYTVDPVPGVVGSLQGLASAGYEVVLIGCAQPWLATLACNSLRALNIVGEGGIVEEHNLVFCTDPDDKVRIAKAMGGMVVAVDDDWGTLKKYSTLGTGTQLIHFNPTRDNVALYESDYGLYQNYREQVLSGFQKLVGAQRELKVASEVASKQQSAVDLQERVQQLQTAFNVLEDAVLPEIEHLTTNEPSAVAQVLLELDADKRVNSKMPSASAVIPWLLVTSDLGVPRVNTVLQVLEDEANPQKAEVLAQRVHRGMDLKQDQSSSKEQKVAGSERTEAAGHVQMPPFYPLATDSWSYPLTAEAVSTLPPDVQVQMTTRVIKWLESVEAYRSQFGIGISFVVPPSGLLTVSELLPGGPAMRTGRIVPGMRLVYLDGHFLNNQNIENVRKYIATRLEDCEQNGVGQTLKRLESFRHMPNNVRKLFEKSPSTLAENGFELVQDAGRVCIRCAYCACQLENVKASDDLWEVHTRANSFCPLLRARLGHQPMPGFPVQTLPYFLKKGLIMGFLPPIDAEDGPAPADPRRNEDLQSITYSWILPEPCSKREEGAKGRIFVDLSRVVLRLNIFKSVIAEGDKRLYRDHVSGKMLEKPYTAVSYRNVEEVVDAKGRVIFVDHDSQTTSFVHPNPLRARKLPSGWKERVDKKGRIFFANDELGKSQWEPPTV